ncbi:DUF2169 family type VI secretion system accessory protein [Amorphus orientalis]|uniref:Uncharacterized protein YjbI with pentapeptide repeats n=1 Tax=Amorphus orientalis TaxID=649198 RepID=A0AAE4AUR3_9HYPH|nr:DUF2169 domain-containing protein [Amorphus orientalis]MDQ0317427.1 uncharacterized protein YjbI with pentapeptide repeats [Amorphus orientalis]
MPGIIKPMRLGVLTKCTPYRKGAMFTVTALGLFDLLEPDYLLMETGLWPMAADQLPGGSVLDFGTPKPNGEVIVAGSAIPPGGHPAKEVTVEAEVGPVSKRVMVVGDRVWVHGDNGPVFTDPVPFTHMPLVPERAFGGEGVVENPVGRGAGARLLYDAGYKAPLPNLENPAHPILDIEDAPHPAWFGPYPLDAPIRRKYMGTYDRAYMKTHFPGYPEDFDTRYFLTAPADQQIDGYFRGDEPVRVAGMSSSHPTVHSRLPGVRARAFVDRTSEPAGLHELHMHLDTVWLFGSVNKGVVAFRGSTEIEDIEGDDVAYVMIAYERLSDPPRDVSYYEEVYRQRRDPKEKIKYLLADYQLSPGIDPEVWERRRASKLEAFQQQMDAFREAQGFQLRKQFEDRDLPPALIADMPLPQIPPVAIPTEEEIERGEADFASMLDDMAEQKKFADTVILELEGLRERQLAEKGITAFDDMPRAADLKPGIEADPKYAGTLANFHVEQPDIARTTAELDAFVDSIPTFDSRPTEQQEQVRSAVAAAKDMVTGAAFENPDGFGGSEEERFEKARARALDLPEAQPFHQARQELARAAERMETTGLADMLAEAKEVIEPKKFREMMADMEASGLDPDAIEAGRQRLAQTEKQIGKFLPAVDAGEPGEGFEALLSSITEFSQSREPLDPDELLRELEAVFAIIEPMTIDGQRKTRLLVPKPTAPMPAFGPETAKRLGKLALDDIGVGDLAGRDLAGADLAGADLSGADLSGTLLEGANLEGANLTGITAHGAALTGANLRNARLARADLKDVNFGAAVLDGADFTGARIENPILMETSLAGIVLNEAHLIRWSAVNLDLRSVHFDRAHIANGNFIRCDLAHASFRGAKIVRSIVIEGSLNGAHFNGAELEKAGFIKTDLERVVFDEARLVSSGFVGEPVMTYASFTDVHAVKTSWLAADLKESCFLRANLRDCSLMLSDARWSDFRLAALHNTLMLRANFGECDFFGANLMGAQMRKANLAFASLRRANAYSADFSLAKLTGADLHHAHLVKTTFRAPETVD